MGTSMKSWREKYPEKAKALARKNYLERVARLGMKAVSDYAIERGKIWKEKNQEAFKAKRKRRQNKKISKDPHARISYEASKILMGFERPTFAELVCDLPIDELRKRFIADGKQVDHIIPRCAFDLTDVEQFLRCFHHTNMQLLTPEENTAKGAKYDLAIDLMSLPCAQGPEVRERVSILIKRAKMATGTYFPKPV